MTRQTIINHEFVRYLPEKLPDGTLYISMELATAAHKCCCGCGREVSTPLTPMDWQLVFDGETVSLDPSIGNWNFPCRSHYFIRRNRVVWAKQWTQAQIVAGRARDAERKGKYFAAEAPDVVIESAPPSEIKKRLSWWQRVRRLFCEHQ